MMGFDGTTMLTMMSSGGSFSFLAWLWVTVWTVNSVLLMTVLWGWARKLWK